MALEQCDYRREKYITDFYLILDHLINTTTDVDLLIDKGIVVNCLGDHNAVTLKMLNKNSISALRITKASAPNNSS